MKNIYVFVFLFFLLISCNSEKKENTSWSVASPDGKIIMKVSQEGGEDSGNKLFYQVFFVDKDTSSIIKPSRLGLERDDQSFIENLKLISEQEVNEVTESYEMITGKKSSISNTAFEKALTFENEKGGKLTLVMRVYNNGVAFKYKFPEEDTTQYTLKGEVTEFHVNAEGDGKAWIQPYEKPAEWGPAYESLYENGIKIGASSRDDAGWAFPALFNTQDVWMLITEANADGKFYGAHLQQNASDGLYKIAMPAEKEALGHYPLVPSNSLPWSSPWRVIMIGDSLGTIVESTLVTDLSEPVKIQDVSWIRPGRSSWSWWSDHTSPTDYNKLIPFIDFTSEATWEYSLIDANWNIMKNGDIKKLIEYADSKNVGLFLWYNSGGIHTDITEQPRDIMSDPEKRKAEFKKLKEWGIKGVKVDFFNSDKPAIMKLYLDILKDAAENEILVVFHGSTLPRGWERTYPNLMSMESVRGAEQYWDSVFAENAHTHHTILPATRNVVGSMDYTPVTFSNSLVPHLTTYAHELALPVVFESGVTHYADRVTAYRKLPADVLDLLKGIPVAWDETHFVKGYPGKEMVLARRKNDDWFIAGINGEKTPKEISLDLSFIDSVGTYNPLLVSDGESADSFHVKDSLDTENPVTIKMLGRGGFILRMQKKQ